MMYLVITLSICVVILLVVNILILTKIKKDNTLCKLKSDFMTFDTPVGNCVIDGEDSNFNMKISNGNSDYNFKVINGQIYSISTNGKKEAIIYKKGE